MYKYCVIIIRVQGGAKDQVLVDKVYFSSLSRVQSRV